VNVSFYIARRYLLSKKSHNAINVISGISVCGVALATVALICTLSVFNGFRDLVATFFTAFDPELKVCVATGKVFDGEDPLYNQALDIVVQSGKASASYIQRRLKIGYNRAARLVEEMEARGIVGPANGSKPREIIHVP